MKNLFRKFIAGTLLTLVGLPAMAQMEFAFSGLSDVKQVTMLDGTQLVQLPAGTDLTQMSTYGMSVTVDGASVPVANIVPNPSTLSYTDGKQYAFYYNGKSYQVRFAAGEYFTAVFFTDASVGSVSSKVTTGKLATYAENITKMGKTGGQHFQFDALPGYNPTADIAFYLGDMTSTNSPTPVIRTASEYSNVTRKCAVVFGQFESFGNNSTITEYGLCLGTSSNPTISGTHKAAADYVETDTVLGDDVVGVFGVYFDDLEASTTYHIRAYCTYRLSGSTTSTTVYGDDVSITTTAGSGFTWAWESSETPDDDAKARITEAMDSAKYYYHNYCNLYKWCGTAYNSGVSTADCSLRSDNSCYIRFGPGERYQWVGTAQHEISHGYGIGQTGAFSGYPKPFQFPIGTLTCRVFFQDMTMTITHDSQHYWPGGINQREEVTNGTANNKGTYTCKNEEMLKCNALILNGFALDGMQTTYGWVKEENPDLTWDEEGTAEARKTKRKVSSSDGGTGFENALDAFNQAGIPLILSTGELDQAHGTTGASADGYTVNTAAYAVVTRSLEEAQNYGVEDVTRFSGTSLSNTIQAQPYAFKFKDVRFYNGLKFWFDKPMYKYSNSSYRYLTPDQVISNLTTYVGNHSTETSVWMQHFPFAAEDYIWLDKTASSDAAGTVYSYYNGTTSYTGTTTTTTYNATYNKYNTAARRRSALTTLINQTANAAHFSGHGGTYSENTANTFTDYTVDAMTTTPGDALIVLMKAGTGVIEVKRVDFRDYGAIVVDDELVADLPTDAENQQNVVLGGLVQALQNLGSSDAAVTAAISTAKNARTSTAVTTAINTLNTAFGNSMAEATTLTDVTALLGTNLDFETAIGDRISTEIGDENQGLFGIPGWTENHNTNQTSWAFCQYKTDQGSPVGSGNSLYLRENWKGSPAQPSTIQVYKDAVLPAGKFRLTFYMRQPYQNYTQTLNYYEINGTRTDFSAGTTWEAKSFDIELSEPSVFRLSYGFQGTTNEGGYACQVDVDNVTLNWIPEEGMEQLDGTYYLFNVETGQYLTAANSWGTQASLGETGIDVELITTGTGYSILTNISNGGSDKYLGSNLYMDAASAIWNFTEKGTQNGKRTYLMSIDGTKYMAAPASGNVLEWTTDADETRALWSLMTKADLMAKLSEAMEAYPVNATFLLPGYGFSRNDGTRNGQWQGSPSVGGAVTNNNGEKWNTNFDVYQTVTDLPNGTYEITMQGFYRCGNASTAESARSGGTETLNSYLYANSQQVALPSIFSDAATEAKYTTGDWGNDVSTTYGYIPDSQTGASAYLSEGLYQVGPLRVTVTDGTLRIGIKKTTLISYDWTVFDNFKLMYLGDGSVKLGDVDKSGEVSLRDLPALIDLLLGNDPTKVKYNHGAADVDENKSTNVSDVDSLIEILMSK